MKKKGHRIIFFTKLKINLLLLNLTLLASINTLPARERRQKVTAPAPSTAPRQAAQTQQTPQANAQGTKKTWMTTLVYVQANNNLSSFALRNFTDMALIGSNQNLNILVQWYQPHHKGIWRYRIEKGKMVLDSSLPTDTDGNSAHDLVDAMRWAVENYPAENYSLILWDHGIGILDPVWGKKKQPWLGREAFDCDIDEQILASNPRIQIEGITIAKMDELDLQADLMATNTQMPSELMHRGILFNERSKTYMDNYSLTDALKTIKEDVLGNKKIDILGMDACLMAMVEVGYLARDYASILVSSQEVELAHGWPYHSFFSPLADKPASPRDVATNLVSCFGEYYKNKIQFYTQSAVDLEHMNTIKESLDAVVKAFQVCLVKHRATMLDLAKRARRSCQQFSISTYVDVCSYLQELYKNADSVGSASLKRSTSLHALKQSITQGIQVIKQSVLANIAGTKHPSAQGLSIYFPLGIIDRSYPVTAFAKDCLWYDFIREVGGH